MELIWGEGSGRSGDYIGNDINRVIIDKWR